MQISTLQKKKNKHWIILTYRQIQRAAMAQSV